MANATLTKSKKRWVEETSTDLNPVLPEPVEKKYVSSALIVLIAGLGSTLGWFLYFPIWIPNLPIFMALACLGAAVVPSYWGTCIPKPLLCGIVVTCILTTYVAGMPALALGPAVLALVMLLARNKNSLFQRGSTALYLLSTTIIVSLVVPALLETFNWFFFDFHLFDTLLYYFISPITDAHMVDGTIIISDGRSQYPLHFDIESLHIAWSIRFLLITGCLCLGAGINPIRRTILLPCLILALLYPIVWSMTALLFWDITKHPGVYLSQFLTIATELVFVIMAAVILRPFRFAHSLGSLPVERYRGFQRAWKGTVGWDFTLAFLFGGCLTLFFLWFPTGDPKATDKLLVDDAHSDWERSDLAFDFSSAGMTKPAGYSYSSFVSMLSNLYDVSVNSDAALNKLDLDQYAVVILKTPSRPYTEEEIRSLRNYVEQGGGLFVHGDHTNLFGMSEHLNDLIADFGIQFNFDDQATYDGAPSLYHRQSPLAHPTIRDVEEFQYLTSATLRASSPLVEPVLVSPRIFSENLRYGRPGYFGDMAYGPGDRLGSFLQGAVVPYGRGRVAVFADSTVFSSFCLHSSYYTDYAIGTIEYLKHYSNQVRPALLFLGLALLIGFVIRLILRHDQKTLHQILTGATLGVAVLIVAVSIGRANAPALPLPSNTVAILCGNGLIKGAPMGSPTNVDPSVDFSGFVQLVQRLNMTPRIYERVTDIPEEIRSIVIINPGTGMTEAERLECRRRVEQKGDTCLIVDSIANRESSGHLLAAQLGLAFQTVYRNTGRYTPSQTPDFRSEEGAYVDPILVIINSHIAQHQVPVDPEPSQTGELDLRVKLCPSGQSAYFIDEESDPKLAGSLLGKGKAYAMVDGAVVSSMWIGKSEMHKSLDDRQIQNLQGLEAMFRMVFASNEKSGSH